MADTDKREGTEFRVPDIIAKDLARHIEDQIIFGDLQPNTRLVEEEIVQRYNVSRSPVREALRALEQEGLAIRESRRGVWVSPLALEDLEEVYTCRIVLEGLATELAAQNHSERDLEAIKSTFATLETTRNANDMREFFRTNLALSGRIHSAANNKTLKRLLGSVGKQSLRYRYLAYSHAPEMMSASVEGNREIIAAIEKRNARHARILMEDLIQRSWTVIRQLFTDNPNAGGA
ncbi:MAG: GntR family transcriptional regulator [Hyphomicrobiales bacterium]|nr:GntR family transcriptional regulator [Hyphomicrobiales bacterium]